MAYHSPLFCLPALGHWVLALHHGHWRFEAHENFIKSSDRNRYWLHSHQDLFRLSLPIEGGRSQKMNIQLVRLDDSTSWRSQHLEILRNAYSSSAFFDDLFPEIEMIYRSASPNLFQFNLTLFQYCKDWVCPQLTWSTSSTWNGPHLADLPEMELPPYYRPYPLLHASSLQNISILDLLFQEGPWAEVWLEEAVKFYQLRCGL